MKFVEDIKKTYEFYRDRAFLKKHGCETWREYNRKFDPDHNAKASLIKDYYHGYPYVYCFENHKHEVYDWISFGLHGSNMIHKWCSDNCSDKFRMDYHRVYKNSQDQWEVNEIGGRDYIFAAFKDQRDFTMFSLRWS